MSKRSIQTVGEIDIVIDVGTDEGRDKKPPHVSLVRHGRVILNHIYLSEVDNLVGSDRETKAAIYWLRDRENKEYCIREYNKANS